MAKKTNAKKPQESKAEEVLEIEEIIEETEDVATPIEEIATEEVLVTVEKPYDPPIKKGIVVNTTMLNMRKHADKNSSIIRVLDKDSLFIVDLNKSKSNDEWYAVRTDDGRYGYCMRDFIEFDE